MIVRRPAPDSAYHGTLVVAPAALLQQVCHDLDLQKSERYGLYRLWAVER
jgi:hypothetical protein